MRSGDTIDYEIRPCKFVERRMLTVSLSRIISRLKKNYQYIGFGAYTFVDFKLFHQELPIKKMISIEHPDGYSNDKLEFNKPYSCINIHRGTSTQVLAKVDLKYPSIAWLDYDGDLSIEMFTDIELFFQSVPSGSVFILSCNSQLKKDKDNLYTVEDFQAKFEDLVPFGIDNTAFAPKNSATTIEKMISQKIAKSLADRKKSTNEKLFFKILYNFVYQDGAKMFTFGGILFDESIDLDTIDFSDLDFISPACHYEIKVPILSYVETFALNQVLFDEEKEQELINKRILRPSQIAEYKKIYKYIPSFHDVRY